MYVDVGADLCVCPVNPEMYKRYILLSIPPS